MAMPAQEHPTTPWEPKWTFADRLRRARREAGLSQEELADLLGVKTSRLSGWESGYNEPRKVVEVAQQLEEKLGVRASWLLGITVTVGYPQRPGQVPFLVPDLPEELSVPEQLSLPVDRTLAILS